MIGLAFTVPMLASAMFTPEAEFVPGELIIKLKTGIDAKTFFSNKNLGIISNEKIKLSYGDLYLVKVPSDKNLVMIRNIFESNPEVAYAEPNFVYRAINGNDMILNTMTEDPRFGELWGLKNTGANAPGGARGIEGADVDAVKAWEVTKGSKAVKVAVIDTGIDYNHPDLADNMWVNEAELNGEEGVDDDENGYVDDIRGWDFSFNDNDSIDGHSHGTHCAGTIGGVHDNGEGVAGVMADVTLVPVKFLSDGGSGSTAGAVKAIDYATSLDVDVMSNSWGGGGFSEALKDSIVRAKEAGIVFVAAAGNSSSDNDQRPHYPSNYDVENVVSVAAHTAQDVLASFSCYGKTTVHIAAPGHKILSTVKNGGYAAYSGTSMATPHVSGAIGLLIAKEGRLEHAALRERLLATSDPIRSYRRKTISGGRLNAYNLVTNTRPDRNEPDPSKWEAVSLDEAFESAHPYENKKTLTKTVTVEGAKYMRAKVVRYDLERGYDFLRVRNKSRAEVDKFSGRGTEYKTEFVEGDTMIIEFSSDASVNSWGFLIEEVEVIR